MQPETRFKIKLMTKLKRIDGLWFVKTQQMSIRGTPDMIMCYKGHFIAMELKRSEDAVITAMQEYNLQKIEQCGGTGIIVHPGNLDVVLNDLFGYAA
jgi:hypothetical protein